MEAATGKDEIPQCSSAFETLRTFPLERWGNALKVSPLAMNGFQKLVVAAWLSIIVLVGAGAIVRATGSGLGCPDWPRCWGCLIPPTQVEDVNFDKIDLEKFRRKAMQHGRDPESITMESLAGEFDARATWIEFINRMLATPAALLSLLVLIAGYRRRKKGDKGSLWIGIVAVAIILANALLGAKVVSSGLEPGVITLHMALAMLLLCVYVYGGWRGTQRRWRIAAEPAKLRPAKVAMSLLLVVTLIEVVMGSQVREMTDALALSHLGESRSDWIGELEQAWSYLLHRSFSWVIVVVTIVFYAKARTALRNGVGWLENVVLGIVLAQMLLGITMAHIHVYQWAQVLHVGLTSLLISAQILWLLGARRV